MCQQAKAKPILLEEELLKGFFSLLVIPLTKEKPKRNKTINKTIKKQNP